MCMELYVIISFFLDKYDYPNFTKKEPREISKFITVRKVENWGKGTELSTSQHMNE